MSTSLQVGAVANWLPAVIRLEDGASASRPANQRNRAYRRAQTLSS